MKSTADGSPWRADIDGLRAVAILAVIAYHFFPIAWPGGFVGVDVFFVISGYLITRILISSLDAGQFSIASFYARRVRRIFPALALVLMFVVLVAWGILYDDERAALGKHVTGGAGFVSNAVLWSEAGYFDAAIESKPLAHLWSLGIEEQFYILWPLILWWMARSQRLLPLVWALAGASLLACLWMVRLEPTAAFYLPIFRFWELLAGGALALHERRGRPAWLQRYGGAVSWAGLGLLACGFMMINPGLPHPGAWTLLPVAGTALVIAAGPEPSLNRHVLGNRVMVWIGGISFPLYLWHWPLLAFARIGFNAEPGWRGMLVLAALSFLLATLTWMLLERPIRAGGHSRRKIAALTCAMAAIAVAGIALPAGQGLHPREAGLTRTVPPGPALGLATNPVLRTGCGLPGPAERAMVRHCLHDGREPDRFALIGDSKAEALYEGLVRTSSPSARWLFVGGTLQHSSVVPVLSDDSRFQRYQAPTALALRAVMANPRIETVAIATATRTLFGLAREDGIEDLPHVPDPAEARAGLARFVDALLAAGKRVILVVDNPSLPDPRRCLAGPRVRPPEVIAEWFSLKEAVPCSIGMHRHLELSARYRALLEEIRARAPARIEIFDTIPLLCDAGRDRCDLADAEGVLYSYTDHISALAAGRIGEALNRMLASRAAGRSAAPPAPSAGSRG